MIDIEELREFVNGLKCPVCGSISEKFADKIRACLDDECPVKRFLDRREFDRPYPISSIERKKCAGCGDSLYFDQHGQAHCINRGCLIRVHSLKGNKYQ